MRRSREGGGERPPPPHSLAELTPASLNELTGREDITAVVIVGAEHGTALRARLQVVGDRSLPSSFFAKLTPTRPVERLFNTALGLGVTEADLYRLAAADLAGVAPVAHAAVAERRSGRSLVLMDDLTDRGFRFGDATSGCGDEEAVQVALTLARLHRRFWETARFATDLRRFTPAVSRVTRFGPQTWRMLRVLPRRYQADVPDEVRQASRILGTHRREVGRVFTRHPRTLIHGDTHRGNIAFDDHGALLLDWQVAAVGAAVKDLAYFAGTSLEVGQRRRIEDEVLSRYHRELTRDHGPDITRAEIGEAYRLLTVTAYIATAVTAVMGTRLQGEEVTRIALQRAVAAVADHDSFGRLRREVLR